MREVRKRAGFSLTEVLLAMGTMAIGMIFVAGVFPVAIYFNTSAAEQTTAAVVADEAFAKIRIIAGDPSYPVPATVFMADQLRPFEPMANLVRSMAGGRPIDPNAFRYPSSSELDATHRRYYWSALCRRAEVGSSDVQVTVFVCRMTGPGLSQQIPAPVGVAATADPYELRITTDHTLVSDGCTIVDDATGRLYQVQQRYPAPSDNIIRLDEPWIGIPISVWVVPPPESGRYPCIAVYQRIIRF
jgi:hypothetical protein